MKYLSLTLTLLGLSSYSICADWSKTTMSYLSGDGYKTVTDKKEQYEILTLEHASGWKYGDNFFFTDISRLNSSNTLQYSEITSRFSSSKTLNQKYSGLIKDYLIALNLEAPSGLKNTQLYGLGLDLELSFFDFFQVNLFIRDDLNKKGKSNQLTIVWQKTFKASEQKFKFRGFLDQTTDEGKSGNKSLSNTLIQPQILWVASKVVDIGIEYQFWRNKYGIKNLDESLAQLIFTWSL